MKWTSNSTSEPSVTLRTLLPLLYQQAYLAWKVGVSAQRTHLDKPFHA